MQFIHEKTILSQIASNCSQLLNLILDDHFPASFRMISIHYYALVSQSNPSKIEFMASKVGGCKGNGIIWSNGAFFVNIAQICSKIESRTTKLNPVENGITHNKTKSCIKWNPAVKLNPAQQNWILQKMESRSKIESRTTKLNPAEIVITHTKTESCIKWNHTHQNWILQKL